jgi:ABC-2 type transport system permease protein
MTALRILRRDLVRYWRNPLRTALLFALPLVMAGVFALVFGSGGPDQITITVLLHDEDEGLLSLLLENAGSSSQADQNLDIVPVGEEGYEMMERGEASALVHLPAGFTADFLAGRPTTVGVVKNPSERFLPMIVEEGVRIGAAGLSEASRVFRPELEQISVFTGSEDFPSDIAVGAVAAGFNQKLGSAQDLLLPPVVTLDSVTLEPDGAADDRPDVNIVAYFLPGFSILGILFLAQSATRDILRDREAGLLRHLMTSPVTPAQYLAGKCLSVFVVSALGFAVLVAIGIAVGVDWGPPVAVAGLVLASALAAGGLLLLLMSFADTERQGDSLTTIVIIVSSLVGGAFLPVSQLPDFLRPVSAATIVYWATDGFSKLIIEGLGATSIALNAGVLTAAGALFMALGALILRRKMARGVV